MTQDRAYLGHLERAQSAESPGQILQGLAVWFDATLPKERGRVLDFGSGPGHAIEYFTRRGFTEIEAYEPNPLFAERLKTRARVLHDEPDHEAFLRSAAGRYDLVFCKDVLEHIAKPRIIETARLLLGALKPGGRLVVSVPHAVSFIGSYTRFDDFTHEIAFTESSLRFVLESAGGRDLAFHGPRFRLSLNPVTILYRLLKGGWHLALRMIYYLENPGSPNLPRHFHPRLVAAAKR